VPAQGARGRRGHFDRGRRASSAGRLPGDPRLRTGDVYRPVRGYGCSTPRASGATSRPDDTAAARISRSRSAVPRGQPDPFHRTGGHARRTRPSRSRSSAHKPGRRQSASRRALRPKACSRSCSRRLRPRRCPQPKRPEGRIGRSRQVGRPCQCASDSRETDAGRHRLAVIERRAKAARPWCLRAGSDAAGAGRWGIGSTRYPFCASRGTSSRAAPAAGSGSRYASTERPGVWLCREESVRSVYEFTS